MPDWVWDGMVPCLGGLRAFAIVCVLVSHFYDFPGKWRVGHFGVISFFVISGFLITLLLLRERRRTGKIALGAFFQRRALRILPAYCLLMLVFYGLQLASIHRISNDTWLAMLTFTQCFVMPTMDPFLNHTWSIAVEEHFYLLWPFLFLRLSLRTVALVLTLFLALSPALRWALLQSSSPVFDIHYSSLAEMCCIAVGCALALVVTGGFGTRMRSFSLRPGVCLGVCAGLFAISWGFSRWDKTLSLVMADPLQSAAFGAGLLFVVQLSPGNPIYRILESRLAKGIGVLSYSIYLWQQSFSVQANAIGSMPLALLLTMLAAGASYFFVEAPFLRLKSRMSSNRGGREIAGRD